MPKCDCCHKSLKKGTIIGWGNWLCDHCYAEFKNWLKNKSVSDAPANIQQQVQLDSEQKQGTFDNPVDAAGTVVPRELA